jgi:hypothetical protein
MKKLSMLGIIGGAAVLTAVPLSLEWSQNRMGLSVDRADARVGRPATAMSVAGVHRRAYRRAYRGAVYGAAGYGVGSYYGGYGYPSYSSSYAPQSYSNYGSYSGSYAPQSYSSSYAPQSYSNTYANYDAPWGYSNDYRRPQVGYRRAYGDSYSGRRY